MKIANCTMRLPRPLQGLATTDCHNSCGVPRHARDKPRNEAHKALDYSFRVGGTRKFFLEAKKPSVDVKDDSHPAYQLRRYAWSAKLSLSILTDFEELAVYDCRIRPVPTDKSSAARVMYMTFREYEQRWDELSGIFSRDAVYRGDFDGYVESTTSKRGTAEVDNAFLKEIAAVPGIDCIFVGPSDLSVSLGIPGQVIHPREVEAIDRVIEVCNKHNIITGILMFDTALLKPWVEKGMRFVAYSSDIFLLADAAAQGIEELRSAVKGGA